MNLDNITKLHTIDSVTHSEITEMLPMGWTFGVINEGSEDYIVYENDINMMLRPETPFDLESIFQNLYSKSVFEFMNDNIVYPFKIYNYIDDEDEQFQDPYHLPACVNYKTQLNIRLYPEHYFIKGELQKTIYYSEYDESTEIFNDEILLVSFEYERDNLGFAVKRQTKRQWYRTNGVLEETQIKDTLKFYDSQQKIREGKRKRENIMDTITITVMGMVMQTELPNPDSIYKSPEEIVVEGRRFLADHKISFSNFIDDANADILTELSEDTTPWLSNVIDANGTKILDYLLYQLS